VLDGQGLKLTHLHEFVEGLAFVGGGVNHLTQFMEVQSSYDLYSSQEEPCGRSPFPGPSQRAERMLSSSGYAEAAPFCVLNCYWKPPCAA
jgi:hypothetical protein